MDLIKSTPHLCLPALNPREYNTQVHFFRKEKEFCLGCVCVFSFNFLSFIYYLFLSQCYSLTTHESGDGRTVGGDFCPNKSDYNWRLFPLPLPLLYLSPPSSCLIMLLCVCLSVCILCVKECVFLRSLCQCVCSSNTGFSPHYSPPPPFFFSPHLW